MSQLDIKEFRAGMYWVQAGYKSFSPEPINRQWAFSDPRLFALLEKAGRALGELNGYGKLAPDVDFFLKMYAYKEAAHSSRIEGIHTGMKEALYAEKDVKRLRRDDWTEVNNYVEAMNFAVGRLHSLPLSNRLLREAHGLLLNGVRGEDKSPGHFRQIQNWIGGKSEKSAVFVPPRHSEVPELMADLEAFLQNDRIELPDLIRAGMAHYQFETIHPFLDGNGRLGRLLIALYLVSRGALSRPILYLSDFFEEHKKEYVRRLMDVRHSHDMNGWLRFFLVGVHETARKGVVTLEKVVAFRQYAEGAPLDGFGRKRDNALKLLAALYRKPVMSSQEAAQVLDMKPPSALALLRDMEKVGLLGTQRGYKNRLLFSLDGYLEIFDPKN